MSRKTRSGLVLVVEDDRTLAERIGRHLHDAGYMVDFAADGKSGLHLATAGSHDAIVLGQALPGMDGTTLCRKLRHQLRKATPVLMLTRRATLDDKLQGFAAGADDFLVRPVDMRELLARLAALIRRDRRHVARELLQVADLVMDTAHLRVTRAGRELKVSPTGLKLLHILMRESPRVVSRRDIEREIWGDRLPDSDTLLSHLYALRKVIDRPFARPLLHTIHSAGYRLADLRAERRDAGTETAERNRKAVG